MMHIIKAKHTATGQAVYFFSEDYATNQNGLDVLFENEWYFLNNLEVLEVTEHELSEKTVTMFNREYLEKYVESEANRPMTVQEAGALAKKNPTPAQAKASRLNGAKHKGKKAK